MTLFTAKPPVPRGLGINIHQVDDDDLDAIAAVGFAFARTGVEWRYVETVAGVYSWTEYDYLVNGLYSRGVRPLCILSYSNPLYEGGDGTLPSGHHGIATDAKRTAFVAFAVALATRYQDKIILELWNEPNWPGFWQPQPSPVMYTALAAAVGPALAAAAPSTPLLGPAAASVDLPWLRECFENGLLDHVHAVSCHPYRPTDPETTGNDFLTLRELIDEYAVGKDVPIACSEWGYSQYTPEARALTEHQQASYLVRLYLSNRISGLPITIWYAWRDGGTNPTDSEDHFGINTYAGAPKLAVSAATTLLSVTQGYEFAGRLKLASDADYAVLFNKGADRVVVAWTVRAPSNLVLNMAAVPSQVLDQYGATLTISHVGDDVTVGLSSSVTYVVYS